MGCLQTCCSRIDLQPCLPDSHRGHLWSMPPHLPTDRMVISPWRPALGVLAGLGRVWEQEWWQLGLRGQQHLGLLAWLPQREQQGPR